MAHVGSFCHFVFVIFLRPRTGGRTKVFQEVLADLKKPALDQSYWPAGVPPCAAPRASVVAPP